MVLLLHKLSPETLGVSRSNIHDHLQQHRCRLSTKEGPLWTKMRAHLPRKQKATSKRRARFELNSTASLGTTANVN